MPRKRKGPLDQLRALRDRLAHGFDRRRTPVGGDDAFVSCRFVAGELTKIIEQIEKDIREQKPT